MKTKLILLAVGSSLLLLGCYVDRPHGYARGPAVEGSYSYVYYPDVEVYYHPQRHVYYWNDGGAWRSGPRVPGNIVLRSHVTVDLKSPEPYRQHEEVRAQHPRHTEDKPRDRGQRDHNQR
jgi:hypothetical protein